MGICQSLLAPPCTLCFFFQLFTSKLFSFACLLCHYILFSYCISFIPSPSPLFCFSPFPSSSLPYLSCHSGSFSSLLLPLHALCLTAFFLSLVLPTPSSLHLHTLFFSFPFFLLLSSTPSSIIPLLDVFAGGVADACLPGFWGAAGVCNDHGKTYALYAITVFRRSQDGSEDCWKTYRRYSDFHDFHMRITEQVSLM